MYMSVCGWVGMCTTSSLSIHLLDGYLGCFHVLAIVNSAVKNIVVHVSKKAF